MNGTLAGVLVANRGEIARRVFRTAREMGMRCVAVYVDADAAAPFVAEADEAIRLSGGYLDGPAIIAAALATGADAIHPGYGFLAENAAFAAAVADAGLAWVGPPPAVIDAMGDKLAAKRAARSGAHTVIASGREPDVLLRLARGERLGTLLSARTMPLAARKQWLADHLSVLGRLRLDAGAVRALVRDGKSLLPIGVTEARGEFERGAVVAFLTSLVVIVIALIAHVVGSKVGIGGHQ